GDDVQLDLLAILVGGRAFEPVADGLLDPELPGFGDGGRAGGGGVGARAAVDSDLGVVGVGVLLALEGSDVALAEVGVIDDPGFAALAAAGPNAFAYRH